MSSVPTMPLFEDRTSVVTPQLAKELVLHAIPMRLAQDLNRTWHSMLPRTDLGNLLCGNMSLAYGAEFGGRYFAVAIWSQPIIRAVCDGHTIELRRLAISDDAPKNTASRMLGVMRRLVKTNFRSSTSW